MRVNELFIFKNEHRSNIVLEVIEIKSLTEFTGHNLYDKVTVRTGRDTDPEQGLIDHFRVIDTKGRTARAHAKGLMFFFLTCSHTKQVVFPMLKKQKRGRQPAFSLAEQDHL